MDQLRSMAHGATCGAGDARQRSWHSSTERARGRSWLPRTSTHPASARTPTEAPCRVETAVEAMSTLPDTPPRVLLVMSDHWPRALIRAELIERGLDAVGTPGPAG